MMLSRWWLALALAAPRFALCAMSDYQVARFAAVEARAEALSEAAKPELLRALDSGAFRSYLAACCPSYANWTADALLGTLVAETKRAEVCTGIPAGGGADAPGSSWSTSMEDAEPTGFLDDQWANRLRHNGSFVPDNSSHSFTHWFAIQDDVEVGAYGLKPFSARGQPATMAEANERGSYALVNGVRSDACSPLYGNLTLVLDRAFVAAGTLVSAIDTGEWTALCNHTYGSPPRTGGLGKWHPYPHDCAAYDFALGTLDHFAHLFLPNARYWAGANASDDAVFGALARKFQLLAMPWAANITGPELIHYWEAMPAMTLPLEESVHFAIADFPALFATPAGDDLRAWCAKNGWPLVWTLGLNTGHEEQFFSIGYTSRTFASSNRILDATVDANLATRLPPKAAVEIELAWADVLSLRTYPNLTNATWADAWANLRAATPAAAVLKPVTAADADCGATCFATDADGACVCRAR